MLVEVLCDVVVTRPAKHVHAGGVAVETQFVFVNAKPSALVGRDVIRRDRIPRRAVAAVCIL
jgi:hypothetical protein